MYFQHFTNYFNQSLGKFLPQTFLHSFSKTLIYFFADIIIPLQDICLQMTQVGEVCTTPYLAYVCPTGLITTIRGLRRPVNQCTDSRLGRLVWNATSSPFSGQHFLMIWGGKGLGAASGLSKMEKSGALTAVPGKTDLNLTYLATCSC